MRAVKRVPEEQRWKLEKFNAVRCTPWTTEGEKIALSRRVDKHWRLIGWGQIRRGARVEVAAAAQ